MSEPIRHRFKPHPLGKDFCIRTITVARAIYRRGLTLPAERRYCGEAKELHPAERPRIKEER